MTPDSLFSLVFVLGLAAVGLLVWSPRGKTPAFCLLAVGMWLLGIVATNSAFHGRGTVWLREPMRRFTYDLKGGRSNSLGKHHVLLAPSQVERLPALFDTQTGAVALAIDFVLQPDGRVSTAKVAEASGNAILDSATADSVRAWQFGALPTTYSPQRAETVRVVIENRYEFLRQSRGLFGLLAIYTALWVATVVLLPSRVTDDDRAEGLVRRALTVMGLLAGLGWVIVWRLAPDLNRFDLPAKQLGVMVVGFPLVWGASWLVSMPSFSAFLVRHSTKFVGLGVFLLVWTGLFGTDLNTGHRLWLATPIGPFQTVELVKLLLLCFVAGTAYAATQAASVGSGGLSQISRLRPWNERYRGLLGGFTLVFVALVFMSDFGPLLLLALLLLALLWAQGYPRHAAGGLLALLLLLTLAFVSGRPARWHDRVVMWRAPWAALKDDSAQLAQGRENTARVLWSISSGGLTGQGIGQGYPDDIGAVESDFIFAAVAEELGWAGGATVISLLLILAVTGLQLAQMRDDALAKTLACGLGAVMAIQAALTIGGNVALWPLTGITLPFLSYGRSSLLISFLAMGLMLGLAPAQRRSWEERPFPQSDRVNLAMGRLQLGACVVFGLLVTKAARLQFPVLRNPILTHAHLQNDAGVTPLTNPRLDGQDRLISTHVVRGSVFDRDGNALVETTPRGRLYRDPLLYASLIGMQENGQAVGLERSLQEALMGQWNAPGGNLRWPRLTGERRGFDVQLTLDDNLQRKAYSLLTAHHYRGCLVGVEPATGRILFAVSNPAPTNLQAWRAAYDGRFERSSPVSTKAPPSVYRTWYQPGSTFKTLTAAAALENGIVSANQHFRCKDGYFPPGGGEINDHDHVSHGDISLSRAMAVSCNQTFAQLGVDVGWRRFWDYSTASGLSTSWSLLPATWRPNKARFWPQTIAGQLTAHNLNPNERSADASLARTAIGQEDVRSTPLYLATWAGAIANGGRLTPPNLVTTVTDQFGRTVADAPPGESIRVMRRSTAQTLTAMMERVVTDRNGTGKAARVQGIRVAAKTGTPQLGVKGAGGGNNALLIAFAPVEKPRIAIAVVVEGLPDGGPTCGPLAAEMIRAVCK